MSYNFNQSAAHSRCERVISQDRPKIPTYAYRGQNDAVKSSTGPSIGVAALKEPLKYTGDAIVGICQMSKSNAIPVFNKDHVLEIGKMRR